MDNMPANLSDRVLTFAFIGPIIQLCNVIFFHFNIFVLQRSKTCNTSHTSVTPWIHEGQAEDLATLRDMKLEKGIIRSKLVTETDEARPYFAYDPL